MPQYVIVREIGDAPHVLTDWCMNAGVFTAIENVRNRTVDPVRFPDRWCAKRFLRKRDGWREARIIPLDRV